MNGAVDSNQTEIVECLRAVGATVHVTSNIGNGFVDLVVGFRGLNFLLECKARGGRLTPAQREWHRNWQGTARVVYGVDEALLAIGALEPPSTPPWGVPWKRKVIG